MAYEFSLWLGPEGGHFLLQPRYDLGMLIAKIRLLANVS